MLFHVIMTVRIPHDADPDMVRKLGADEHERATGLQQQGKWLHLWRIAGKYANVSIFNVESRLNFTTFWVLCRFIHLWRSRSQPSAVIRDRSSRPNNRYLSQRPIGLAAK
jgi:muconolactone delta-isomerase